MRFCKHLYLTEAVEKKKDKIIKKLQEGKFPLTCYIVVLLEEGENQLEFYSGAHLYQSMFDKDDLLVAGIAESQIDALYLVEEIAAEVYEHTGNLEIRSYILNRENQ